MTLAIELVELPACKRCLQYNVVVVVDYERNNVGVGMVVDNEHGLVRSGGILEDREVLPRKDEICDLSQGNAPFGLELSLLVCVPDDRHSLMYDNVYALSSRTGLSLFIIPSEAQSDRPSRFEFGVWSDMKASGRAFLA